MTTYSREARRQRRAPRLSRWHRFVLLVGYAALFYALARGVIWVLVWLGGMAR